MSGIAGDLSKQDRLREQCHQYFDMIEGGVCIVTADGTERIVFANGKAASLYECADAEDFLSFVSSGFRSLMEEEDYRPLAEMADGHPEHIPLSFQYRTKKGHFRKAEGVGSLRDTPFGRAYVLLIFSAEQIASDQRGLDKTGVLGAHDFFEEARKQATEQRALPSVRALCPVSLDLTSFKEYNRLYGVHQGDLCLRKIADVLTGYFPGALIGHLTADHFNALLPPEDLEAKLEHVCSEVNAFINDDGIRLKVGIYMPREEDTLDDLLHAFDWAKIACDSIKTDGNRSIAVYQPSMGENFTRKAYVLRHFNEALEKHYIKVYFQPLIRTLTGKICGFEALARWEDPVLGMIYPQTFIPVLEDAQLINRLDRYVLEQVARLVRDRMNNGLPLVSVSMNLSAYDFDVANPIDTIEKTVNSYRIPRTVLCFEITERVMFRNHLNMSRTVQQFQEAGYQVWMDDFGSEYSSLNSLHNYHFDVIKVDMGFFSHFDDRSRQIITSVVTMARMLGVQTLAEGVETREQVDFLKKIGCGRIQGFYYGQPMMYEDTFSFILGRNMQLEQPEEAHLMNAAESVNVISDSPTALFSFDGKNITLLMENDAYKRELRSTGTQNMAEANANLMDTGYPFRESFQHVGYVVSFERKLPEVCKPAKVLDIPDSLFIEGQRLYRLGIPGSHPVSDRDLLQNRILKVLIVPFDRIMRIIFSFMLNHRTTGLFFRFWINRIIRSFTRFGFGLFDLFPWFRFNHRIFGFFIRVGLYHRIFRIGSLRHRRHPSVIFSFGRLFAEWKPAGIDSDNNRKIDQRNCSQYDQ